MLKPVYIQAARAMTAQDTFLTNEVPDTVRTSNDNILFYQEPDYLQYMGMMQLRRMSKITKVGMVTAIQCLADAGIAQPQAIITGTGKGSLSDTERFLKSITEFKETTLNPTPFIQSTYNALNGMIALHHNSHGYNTTYVHRGFSLENALTDAIMLLNDGDVQNALVGSFEEITAEHFIPKQKLGYWKKEKINSGDLLQSQTEGSIAGEGTCFFALTATPEKALVKLCGLKMVHKPTTERLVSELNLFLTQQGVALADIDVLITGRNGDARTEHFYDAVEALTTETTSILAYKHLTGEFDTAAGFGLWSACQVLTRQMLPSPMLMRTGAKQPFKNVLVYNHYYGTHHAFYLLQSVH